MVLLFIILISVLHLSAANFEIDRQSSNNENYDSLNRYRPGDSSSYGASAGYYPRTVYDQINQNKINSDINGREFRPPNVFAAGIISSPYNNPLLAQPRQYQTSMPGVGGFIPYQLSNAPPLLQSPGYPFASPLENQYPGGYNSPMSPYAYGGIPNRIGIGETAATAGQGFGNYLMSPYYGLNGGNGFNRQSLGYSQQSYFSPYAAYGPQGYAHSPQYNQLSNYPTLGYANQPYGHVSKDFGAQTFPYQNQPFINGQYGYNGYNSYNGVNGNTGVNLGQNGVSENAREERNYATSATHNENVAHSGSHLSNETPAYGSKILNNQNEKSEEQGFYKRKGFRRIVRNKVLTDQSMTE